ncbi:MAG: hypothetical protein JWO07_688 [Candidatus Saccharibacteria bacterium]|nr:hypothetical protein [Candidatus Saccharibacteria bacterium]
MYCYDRDMIDTLIHRWFHVPYALTVRHLKRPKRPQATLLFIHGLGNTGDAWSDVIKQMPPNVRIITVDLLGFGDSPSPKWALYDAKTQARSVLATLLRLRITTPVVVIGHSLGSLVAIEMAKRYPLLINRLILCSPPLYDDQKVRLPRGDDLLRQMYSAAADHPDRFLRLAAFAMRYRLINKTFNVTTDNVDSYMAALSAMIINQTSLHDAYNLKVLTTIIRGTLDPVVIAKNLNRLQKLNPLVTVKAIIAGHEVKGRYVKSVVKVIHTQLDEIATK